MAYRHSKPYANGDMDIRVTGRYAKLLLEPNHPDFIGVEDLDTEELARGQLKDKNGRFTGRPPKFLPRQIVDAMKREHYARVNAILENSLSDMVKTMRAIALDEEADDSTRLKAAIYVFERFMGKTPDKINVTQQSTVDDIVDDIMYDINEKQKTEIEKELDLAQEELRDTPRRVARRRPAQRTRERR